MASAVPPAEGPPAHTSTQQWQSFEMRMRQRRIDRLLLRAQIAHEAGRDDDAREALAEADQLNGNTSSLAALHALTLPPPTDETTDIEYEDADALDGATLLPDTHQLDDGEPLYSAELTVGAEAETWSDEPIERGADVVPPPRASRRAWIPRVAGALTVLGAVVWFAAPELSHSPQAHESAPPAQPSGTAATASDPSASGELSAVRLAVTDVAPATETPEPAPPSPERREVSLVRHEDSVPLPAVAQIQQPTSAAAPPVVPVSETTPLESALSGAAPIAPPTATAAALTSSRAPSPAADTTADDSASPAPSAASEETAVRAALRRYESAYSQLDADAAGAVWPGLDRKALARAFDGLASQSVNLGYCDVRVAGEIAFADCAGSATWTPKVGGGTRRQPRRWQFRLQGASGGWQIVGVTVR